MRKSQMLDLASDAVTQGWLKYPLTQAVMPPVEYCKEGYAGEQWIWICDYEGAAFELQNMLYGQSNITLAEDRKNALDFSNGKTMTTTRHDAPGLHRLEQRRLRRFRRHNCLPDDFRADHPERWLVEPDHDPVRWRPADDPVPGRREPLVVAPVHDGSTAPAHDRSPGPGHRTMIK